jgi:tRNA(fMet)-specific endonuclease VapC
MTGEILLDTNTVIDIFNDVPSAQNKFKQSDRVLLCSPVLGELFYGAFKSTKTAVNVARVERFATQLTVLSCDTDTARWFGKIKHGLIAKGRPIPVNDMWVAAVAKQHDLTVATRDQHFQEPPTRPVWHAHSI